MIFYEAPHKLTATLRDLRDTFGAERRISLCRELSKLHEEIRRTTLGEAAAWYEENPPKGEFVLVIEGVCPPSEDIIPLEQGVELVAALQAGGASLRDAVRQAAKDTGLSRNELYHLAVERERTD